MGEVQIVIGECGEYDDYDRWNVKAFLDKEKAEEFAKKAFEESKEVLKEIERSGYSSDKIEELRQKLKYDKKVIYATIRDEVYYFLEEIEFEE